MGAMVNVYEAKTQRPQLLNRLVGQGLQELVLLSAHAVVREELPLHHRDPFDRSLIAQAVTDSLTLASYDQRASACDVERITG